MGLSKNSTKGLLLPVKSRLVLVQTLLLLGSGLSSVLLLGAESPPEVFERQVYLMGTWARVLIHGSSRQEAMRDSDRLIEILAETERELTTWSPHSRISRINRLEPGESLPLDPPLCGLLERLRHWTEKTGRAFDPALGLLISVWDIRGTGNIPGRPELEKALEDSGMEAFQLSSACVLEKKQEAAFDSGAFGKGEALRRALEFSEQKGLGPWLIDLGGQLAVYDLPPGQSAWEVALADPDRRLYPVASLEISTGSLATSGSFVRDKTVEGRRISHLLDPRTGEPAAFAGQVTVWSEDPLVADILATALFVMGPEAGLEWAEAHRTAASFLESGSKQSRSTSRFLEIFDLRPDAGR